MRSWSDSKEDQGSFHRRLDCICGWESSFRTASSECTDPSARVAEHWLIAISSEPPFDRHDWIVTRNPPSSLPSSSTTTVAQEQGQTAITVTETTPNSKTTTTTVQTPEGTKTTTRYVIDYYAAGSDADGHPIFSLDVRPALDSLEAVNQRLRVSLEEWMRGSEQ